MHIKESIKIWLLIQFCSNVLLISNREVVFPKRHHETRLQNDLGTLNQNGIHEADVTYEVKTKNGFMVLDLKKIEKLPQQSIYLRSFENRKESLIKHYPQNCYYEGKVRGQEDSYAFISTCSGGMTGSIESGDALYEILPIVTGVGHDFRHVSNILKKLPLFDNYKNDSGVKRTFNKRAFGPIELVDIESIYLPYIRDKTLYIEMLVSCDHRMLPSFNNNRSLLIENILNVFAQIDKGYQAINIRIAVVAIDIQEKKPAFVHSDDLSYSYNQFKTYVDDVIKKTSAFKDVNFDSAMFLSMGGVGGGKAGVGSICGPAKAISDWLAFDGGSRPGHIGHELGHNLGFRGDSSVKGVTCTCLTPERGCYMMEENWLRSFRPGFSDCNMKIIKEYIANNNYGCLENQPSIPIAKVCGNGIREKGEECDCGSLEMCRKNGDNCCQPNGCVLKVNAQCSYANNPECCSTSCLLSKQGTLCRKKTNECDIEEYCEGSSADCPNNKTLRDGTPCANSKKFCSKSECTLTKAPSFKLCPISDGKECSGNGDCASDGSCVCKTGFNPANNCRTKLNPINGGWSGWSTFTSCSTGCGGGTQKRYRFCSSPAPKYGGVECKNSSSEESKCNIKPCPVAESCLAIRKMLEKEGQPLYDGKYTIKPTSKLSLEVYCDMTRDGGGWTLLVSSHSNTWDNKNVLERNILKPDLYKDYSIFKYGNEIKNNYKIKSDIFNYRLEAQELGRWGGLFSAPLQYDISSSSDKQTNVKVLKKFDDWEFGDESIGQRLPYVSANIITTSISSSTDKWGSLTGDKLPFYPSSWIKGNLKMEMPEHIWYWIKEGTK